MTPVPLELPLPPERPAPFRFPIIAASAPVILAVGIFVVTGSAFTLAFAALGPATAIAGYFDSRWSARKLRRRETTRFAIDRDRVGDEIERRHADERTRLFDASPDPARLVTHEGPDPHRWRGDGRSPILVVVGTASIPSMLPVDAPAARISGPPSDADRAIADLVDRARVLERAPMTVDARLGIGVTGPPAFARAIARGIAVQLARRLSPSHCWRSASSAPYDLWLDDLPHEAAAASLPGSVVEFGQKGEAVPLAIVAVAETPAHLPGACSIVLGVVDGQLRILSHPDADDRRPLHPLPVTEIEAAAWALRLSRDAAREGMTSPHALLPDAVELTPLLRPAEAGAVASLACEPGVDAGGSVTLDLVAHGPHAVIGGTTGSGKSELLIAWILAMAASRSPQHVSFLLIDYKGGATFAALARLPHTVGIITDLDAMMAARALDSLRAEVRHRERLLVASGARSIEQVDSLPRLVIVVDEFAAMLAELPDLHGLFADLAARGRSLGMHLVLCTQRPAGAVRDGVLANADLRVSLRVNNRADSSAVVGCDDAAGIPLTARGRGVLRLAGEAPRSVQFALASGSDVVLVTQRWSQSPSPRRPWCEPLPAVLKAAALPRDGIGCFGLVDLPSEQRQEPAIHSPEAEGALLVLGSPASGKSTALRALATGHPGVRVVPAEPDGAWDVIADLVAALDTPAPTATCVVLDDLDALVPRFTGEYRAAFVDLLARVLREGPGRGITALLSAQRITGESQGLATLVPGRLLLRHPSRQDFVIAGGEGGQFVAALPAGRGLWRGQWMQVVADPPPLPATGPTVAPLLDPRRARAIVTSRVAPLLARWPSAIALSDAGPELRSLALPGVTIVGDLDEWQSRWGAVAALRTQADIVLDGCTPADFRAITRSRQLPPPLAPGQCWQLNEDGSARRVRLDPPTRD